MQVVDQDFHQPALASLTSTALFSSALAARSALTQHQFRHCPTACPHSLPTQTSSMAAPLGFAHLWQQSKFADVELAVCVEPADAASAPTTLQTFPAHRCILSHSPVLETQMLWPTHCESAPPEQAAAANNDTESSCGSAISAKRQVVLTLQSESQQPAALAVLAAMYGVKPVAVLLAELSQEQQLDAAIVAHMLQLPAIGDAAVQALVTAAKGAEGLSASLIQHYQQLRVYPTCLLPLLPCVLTACSQPNSTAEQKTGVKHVLLSVLGDLEEVWADAALRDTMLQLPLAAMKLLLSYDELKGASEDTVLYTAQTYLDNLSAAQRDEAQQQLAPLVRCPHLSSYWLTQSVLSEEADGLLLSDLQPQLKKLLALRSISGPGYVPSEDDLAAHLPDAPDSWSLPRRTIKAVSSVQLVWQVNVADIKEAAMRCASQELSVELKATDVTPPLGGMAFGLKLRCKWDADAQPVGGVKLRVFAVPKGVPEGALYKAKLSVEAGGVRKAMQTPAISAPSCRGWPDFFNLGAMSGGWDEAAWAAKGQPTSGQLKIVLTVKGVGHCK